MPTGVRRLSLAEQQERREKGLCFNCDEQFRPGHGCKRPQFLLLETGDGLEIEPCLDNHDTSSMEITLNALIGTQHPETMRLSGMIKKRPVTILVDSGATLNFLHLTVAKQCELPVSRSDLTNVTAANGGIMQSLGRYHDIILSMQGYTFTSNFFLLPICGYDVILGAKWLKALGTIHWDFKDLQMQFRLGTELIQLKGVTSVFGTVKGTGEFTRLFFQQCQGTFVYLLQSTTRFDSPLHPSIGSLLKQFADIFGEPQGLLPSRSHDHRIPMIPGNTPTNV